jgi:predicted glycosyltransferase
MKIFIDIGHPAHVHYFKFFVQQMKEKGHAVTIVSRDKEVTFQLLDFYKLSYTGRGKGRKGFLGKLFYILKADTILLRKARQVKPDVFVSFGSPYAAHTAWLMRKPHIAFDDTDNNFFEHILYVPFTKAILTPEVYRKDFGKKHVRFNGFMELSSTHPNVFTPHPEQIEKLLTISPDEKYIVLRFVSWKASHDMGLEGLSMEEKYRLVAELSVHARVIISSESDLPEDLRQYAYSIHPALMHDLLGRASLLISESLTMSAEASFLGTPNICISPAEAGTLDEEVRLGLIELYRSSDGIIERAREIIQDAQSKSNFAAKSARIVKEKIDLSALMVWFVENYPNSLKTLQDNRDFQNRFQMTHSPTTQMVSTVFPTL